MELKDWIRTVRDTLKLSQTRFGEEFSVTKGNVSAWENGRHSPSFEQLARMSQMSGMSLPGGTVSPDSVKNPADLSRSANSQNDTDSTHSSNAPTITYEVIRDVVAGALHGLGVSYESLVDNEEAARHRVEALLGIQKARPDPQDLPMPSGSRFVKSEGGMINRRTTGDRRKKETR